MAEILDINGIKEKLLKIHADAGDKPQALEDIHGVIRTKIYNMGDPMVPLTYRSKFGRIKEVQELVDQAGAIGIDALKELQAGLPQLPRRRGGNAEEELAKKRKAKEEAEKKTVADDQDPKPHPKPKAGRRKTKKAARKTRKTRKYSRRQ